MRRSRSLLALPAVLFGVVALAGCSAGDVSTPEGAVKAYMQAIQDGKMDRAAELLSGDALSTTEGAVIVTEPPSVKISDLKVGETTTGEHGPEVAVSYSVNGEPVRSKLATVQVRIDDRDAYRVASEPAVLVAEGPIRIGKQEIKSGKAILGPGVYQVKRIFNSELVAEKDCTGKVTVSTSADGAGQLSNGDSCLTKQMSEMKLSGPAADQAKGQIEKALTDLVSKCSQACRPDGWEQVTDPAQMGKLPDDCKYREGIGVLCDGQGLDQLRPVNLVRFKLSGGPKPELSIADSNGKVLSFRDTSIQRETCTTECMNDARWSSDGASGVSGSYKGGKVTIN